MEGRKQGTYLNLEESVTLRQDLSVKQELPGVYLVEEVDLGAGQEGEENYCRRKIMCQGQVVRRSMVES